MYSAQIKLSDCGKANNSRSPLGQSNSNRHGDLRLLLVEDNSWDADLFVECLRDRVSITVASNGGEAFDRIFRRGLFASEPLPHLIVVDLNISILNGHELLNAVREHSATRHIPIIVWSGSRNPVDIRRAYDFGACAYLVKRSSLPDMENALRAFADFWLRDAAIPNWGD